MHTPMPPASHRAWRGGHLAKYNPSCPVAWRTDIPQRTRRMQQVQRTTSRSVALLRVGQTYVPPTPLGSPGLGVRRHRRHRTNRSCSWARESWAHPAARRHPADSQRFHTLVVISLNPLSARGPPEQLQGGHPRRAMQSSPSAWSCTHEPVQVRAARRWTRATVCWSEKLPRDCAAVGCWTRVCCPLCYAR